MAIALAVDQRSRLAERTRHKPLRILVLAFDCHPTLPSLPVVVFKVCKELAKRCEITVVSRTQDDHFSVPGAETVFLNLNWIKNPFDGVADLLRGGRSVGWTTKTAFTYPTYLAFEHAVWRRYRNALQQNRFDVVLRVSPMSPVLPSPMAKWCPVPFVLGPVNGGLPFPQEVKGAGARNGNGSIRCAGFLAAFPMRSRATEVPMRFWWGFSIRSTACPPMSATK